MDKTLADILGSLGLPTEITESLQEAFNKKVAETRAEVEQAMREEFGRRYEHDKSNLVEAVDRMLTDVIKTHEEAKQAEIGKLAEAKEAFRTAQAESRKEYRTKMRDHIEALSHHTAKQLSEEAAALRNERKSMREAKAAVRAELAALKESNAQQMAARLKKIDEFVVKQVSKEIKEFAEDHRALNETHRKLVAEGKAKLRETQVKFIKESAAKVEAMVNENLKEEFKQLHEDLERNRQNMFGRRLFEAFAGEYMASYLSEGTEIRKTQAVLESTKAELAATKAKLEEAARSQEAIQRKAQTVMESANRTKIMSELLSNLRGEKRRVMEGMLGNIKTESLREAFNRLHPVVLNESARKPAAPAAKPGANKLMEQASEKRTVTGNRANRLYESASAEVDETENEIGRIIHLAGIK